MNAWRACPRVGNACKPTNPAEGVFHHAGGDPPISRRQEHVIVRYGQSAPLFEILVKGFHRRGVQGDQAALAKLGATDLQDALGQYVKESKVERFGNAQPCRSNQSEQRPINLPPKGVRLAKPTSPFQELHNLGRGVDVR